MIKIIKRMLIILIILGCLILLFMTNTNAELNDNIAGHWELTNMVDSVGLHDGSNSGASATTGFIGGGYDCQGGGDKITLTAFDIDTTADFTTNLWYKNSDNTQNQYIFSQWKSGDNTETVWAFSSHSSNTIGSMLLTETTYFNNNLRTYTPNSEDVWQMLTMSYDSSTKNMTSYHNGVPHDTTILSADPNQASVAWTLCGYSNGGDTFGVVDEATVWADLKTDAEILTLYQLQSNGMTYPFYEINKSNIEKDLKVYYNGEQNAVDTYGTYSRKITEVGTVAYTTGKWGGSNQAMTNTADNPSNYFVANQIGDINLAHTEGTLSFWYKADGWTTDWGRILSTLTDADKDGIIIGRYNNLDEMFISLGDGVDYSNHHFSYLPNNTWQHIVITFKNDGTIMKAYVDGVSKTITHDAGANYQMSASSTPLHIFSRTVHDAYQAHGSIQDIMFFGKVLTVPQIEYLDNLSSSFANTTDGTNSEPTFSDFEIKDLSGDTSFQFGEYFDYISINVSDADDDTLIVNLTVTNGEDQLILTNISMTNISTIYTYNTDILLDSVGNWSFTIYANDGTVVSEYKTSRLVTAADVSDVSRIYGYDLRNLELYSNTTSLISAYDYYVVESRITNTDTWSSVLDVIGKAKNNSQLVVLTLYDDLTNISKTNAYIDANYGDLIRSGYLNGIRMLKLYINADENATNSILINNISKNIFQEVNNYFPIYIRNYNHSDLNLNYVQVDTHDYITSTDRTDYITQEMDLMHDKTTKSRMYYDLSDIFKTYVLNFQNNVLNKLRDSILLSTYVSPLISELENRDVIVFNNKSTSNTLNFLLNNSVSGLDVYDLSNKKILELNTDLNVSVTTSSYDASVLYLLNLSHIEVQDDDDMILFGGSFAGGNSIFHTDSSPNAYQFVSGTTNPDDARIIITDPSYEDPDFYVWYGTNGYEAISNWSRYDKVIFGDNTNKTWVQEIANATEMYGYVSVNTYGVFNMPVGCTVDVDCASWNRTYWLEQKKSDIEFWTNMSINVNTFIDGLDIGEVNDIDNLFGDALEELANYIMVTKDRLSMGNTYTSYRSYSNLFDYTMRESACGRWDVSASNPTYSYESISTEVERANFHTRNGKTVLAQIFGDITDYEKAYYCFMQTKVLYGDLALISYNQPLFDYTGATDDFQWNYFKYPNVGSALEDDYSIDGDIYSRRFENGIIKVNTVNHTVEYENNLKVNYIQLCSYYYDNDDEATAEGHMRFIVNDNYPANNTNSIIVNDSDLTAFVKTWKCVNMSTSIYEPSGFYELEFYYVDDDANYVGNGGLYMYHGTDTNTDRLSFYENHLIGHPTADETDYTYYATDDNWAMNLTIDTSAYTAVDEVHSVINRTEVTNAQNNKDITFDSVNSWGINIYDKKVYLNKPIFDGVYVDSYKLNISNSNCNVDNPTYANTNVSGDIWQACYYNSSTSGFYTKVVIPHLSEQNYTVKGNATDPIVNGIRIYPTTAYTNDNLQGFCNISDEDDSNISTQYRWFKDGVLNNAGSLTSICYQETANTSNIKDGDCSLNYSGNYRVEIVGTHEANIYVNYSMPPTTLSASWMNKVKDTHENVTIPSSCFDNNIVSLKINLHNLAKTYIGYCYNYTSSSFIQINSETLHAGGSSFATSVNALFDGDLNTYGHYAGGWVNLSTGGFAEEGIYWEINNSYLPEGIERNINNLSSTLTAKNQNWTFSCRGYDGKNYSDWSNTSVLIINSKPSNVSSVALDSYSPAIGSDINCSFSTGTDPDIDSLTDNIFWYKNGLIQTAKENSTTISSADTSSGDKWYCSVRQYDGEVFSSFISSPNSTVNNISVVNSVTISPNTAYTNSTLQGFCNISDDNGDNIKYFYKWYLNDVFISGGNTTNTTEGINLNLNNISSTMTYKNQNWTFSCMGYDGKDYTDWSNSTVKTIQNSLPICTPGTVAGLLNMTHYYTNESIRPIYVITDIDGDNVSIDYKFYLNNVLNKTYNSLEYCYQETSTTATDCGGLSTGSYNGDHTSFFNDGNFNTGWFNESLTESQFQTTIINYTKPIRALNTSLWLISDGTTPGTQTNLTILESCFNQDILQFKIIRSNFTINYTCYNGSDYSQIRFSNTSNSANAVYEEGMYWDFHDHTFTTLAITADLFNITSSQTAKSNNWTIGCSANDGTSSGLWLNTTNRYIINAAPSIDSILIYPLPAGDQTNLTCNITSNDIDSDAITTTYNWSINGNISSIHTNTFNATNTSINDVIYCMGIVTDGIEYTNLSSASLTIGDITSPILNNSRVDDQTPVINTVITFSVDCTDADSSIATGYPKINIKRPDNTFTGNLSMSLSYNTTYTRNLLVDQLGDWGNITIYCQDGNSNLATLNSTVVVTVGAAPVTPTTPAGGGGVTTVQVIQLGNETGIVLIPSFLDTVYLRTTFSKYEDAIWKFDIKSNIKIDTCEISAPFKCDITNTGIRLSRNYKGDNSLTRRDSAELVVKSGNLIKTQDVNVRYINLAYHIPLGLNAKVTDLPYFVSTDFENNINGIVIIPILIIIGLILLIYWVKPTNKKR